MAYGPLPPPPRRGGSAPGSPAPRAVGTGPGAPSGYGPPGGQDGSGEHGRPAPPAPAQPWARPAGSGADGGWSPSWSPSEQRTTDGVAIAALVTGILGLLASLIPVVGLFVGVPLALAAIVCGIIGLRRGFQRGLAIGGLVTGALAILVSIAYVLLFALVWSEGPSIIEDVVGDAGSLGDGPLAGESPCEGSGDTVTFDTPLEGGGIRVHQVQACPDFVDDVQFGVEVENAGSQPRSVSLEVSASSGGGVISSSVTEVELPAGERGWVDITTFDDWQAPDEVDVNLG